MNHKNIFRFLLILGTLLVLTTIFFQRMVMAQTVKVTGLGNIQCNVTVYNRSCVPAVDVETGMLIQPRSSRTYTTSDPYICKPVHPSFTVDKSLADYRAVESGTGVANFVGGFAPEPKRCRGCPGF